MPTTDRRSRRLAIARRRERIAAQPRVGDRLWFGPQHYLNVREVRVLGVTRDAVYLRERDPAGDWWRYQCLRADPTLLGWRELVRRARRTQEGSAQ